MYVFSLRDVFISLVDFCVSASLYVCVVRHSVIYVCLSFLHYVLPSLFLYFLIASIMLFVRYLFVSFSLSLFLSFVRGSFIYVCTYFHM